VGRRRTTRVVPVLERDSRLEEEEADGWPPAVSGREKRKAYPFGSGDAGPGWLSGLGRIAPPRPFSYFLFLSLFFFWFSKLFQIFCKCDSN
jgi:hypothetical protein